MKIVKALPFLKPILRPIKRSIIPPPQPIILFSGWGMSTEHQVPWIDDDDFNKINEDVKALKFTICNTTSEHIDWLKWRHWNVCFFIKYASKFSNSKSFVECGVGDGLSAYFSLKTLAGSNYDFHLYDSWGVMKGEYLGDDEQKYAGRYDTLSLENTKKNLKIFKNVHFHTGYIPDTFDDSSPQQISYLHIDLNSAKATLAALQFFYDRLSPNGIILFDDYGWVEYDSTRSTVDYFLSRKDGEFLKMPTGQSVFFKYR